MGRGSEGARPTDELADDFHRRDGREIREADGPVDLGGESRLRLAERGTIEPGRVESRGPQRRRGRLQRGLVARVADDEAAVADVVDVRAVFGQPTVGQHRGAVPRSFPLAHVQPVADAALAGAGRPGRQPKAFDEAAPQATARERLEAGRADHAATHHDDVGRRGQGAHRDVPAAAVSGSAFPVGPAGGWVDQSPIGTGRTGGRTTHGRPSSGTR